MKKTIILSLTFLLIFFSITTVSAQTSESIWLTVDTTSYKTEEIVVVRVNAISSTSVQGFTFQIRYDPNCLKPINASSPVAGMNGLQLPQSVGLVDASFASTSPQTALGILAEVTFQTLGGCQTDIYLESAALAVRNEEGYAVPLSDITLGERNITLSIDNSVGNAPQPALLGTPLPLEPAESESQSTDWTAIIVVFLLFGFGITVLTIIFIVYKRSRSV